MTSTFDIIFNNESSYSKGLYVVRRPDIPAPEPIYEPYEIPGHDGILMPVDMRYGPLEIDVEMNFMSSEPTTWGDAYRVAKEWLDIGVLDVCGLDEAYKWKLSFSDDTSWFYKVYSVNIIESERTTRRIGTFTAHFVCDPYCYTKEGENGYTLFTYFSPINNEHPIIAKPKFLIQVSGMSDSNGTTEIIVNRVDMPDKIFSIETVRDFQVYHIDTENGLITAYQYNIPSNPGNVAIWNTHASGNFEDLYLPPYSTTNQKINLIPPSAESTYNVISKTIFPRWRTL